MIPSIPSVATKNRYAARLGSEHNAADPLAPALRLWLALLLGVEDFGERDGFADVVALGVVDAELPDHSFGLFVGHEFGDRFFAEASGDADDGFDHELVDLSAGGVFDEFAVDLDVVEGEVFEVVEGSEAGAEVIEREAAAVVAEVLRERLGVGDVGDGGCLGDFEDEVCGVAVAGSQSVVDCVKEGWVAERFAGDVDF